MTFLTKAPGGIIALAILSVPAWTSASAQQQSANNPPIVVNGQPDVPTGPLVKGPQIKGIITARSGSRVKIVSSDGTNSVVTLTETTKIKASGVFSDNRKKLTADALLNGLPVVIDTAQFDGGLVATQIKFRNNDMKTANMIRNGTAQQFSEQAAATEALRGRMSDIDKYNLKSTTNVYFQTGKADLSAQAKADLCAAASAAEAVDNALMLVVGYTDSTGSDDVNQALSEKRAAKVINYLQQACRWKPYRMLTPTGMASADPAASNDTPEGKAQNRRVSVNVLVSKGLDGL